MKEKINLERIRKQNAKRLESLLSNPKKMERLAKKEYGDRLKIVYAGQRHYENSQIKK